MVAAVHCLLLVAAIFGSSVHALQYNATADSWARYSKWNLCPHRDAVLYLRMETLRDNGLIAYMEAGSTDYMLLKLEGSKLALEYKFGVSDEPAEFVRGDREMVLGTPYFITIRRNRMRLKLELEDATGAYFSQIPNYGNDLCFGECRGGLDYLPSADISDLYIGGLPPLVRNRASRKIADLPPNFEGEIYDVEYKNCECRRSNPLVLEVGDELKSVTGEDPCFNKTSDSCPCRLNNQGPTATCQCTNSDCDFGATVCPTGTCPRRHLEGQWL